MVFITLALGGLVVGWMAAQLDPRNRYGRLGYLVVALMGAQGSGYGTQLLLHPPVDPLGFSLLWIGCLGALVAVLALGIATAHPRRPT